MQANIIFSGLAELSNVIKFISEIVPISFSYKYEIILCQHSEEVDWWKEGGVG